MTIRPEQFEVHPSSGVPIYVQVMEQVQALIAGGHLKPGEMLPSVREMAAALDVNHMTISKAYSKLEADGALERRRGVGMVVIESAISGTAAARREELRPEMERAVVRGRQLGLTDAQIEAVLRKILSGK